MGGGGGVGDGGSCLSMQRNPNTKAAEIEAHYKRVGAVRVSTTATSTTQATTTGNNNVNWLRF